MSRKWIIKDLLSVTSEYLKKKDIDNPRLCAEMLLAHQLKTTRIKLYLDFDKPLGEKDVNEYRTLIQRRLKREPVQYITGVQEFRSMEFMVGPQVMVPRPETEILLEHAISILKDKRHANETETVSVLDMGTGSGAIAISLALEFPNGDIWASDVSADAIETAKSNALKHGVGARVQFILSDLFSAFNDKSRIFDVIVSNPPYIPAEDYDMLPPEVRKYEPRRALDGGEEGLFFINRLILEAKDFLKPRGWLLIEMAPFQTPKAMALVERTGFYEEKKIVKDYSHKERVLIARKRQALNSNP